MGWICISDSCEGHINTVTGAWDGTGIAYFSIKDEILILHDRIFEFLRAIAPTEYAIMFIFFLIIFVVALFVSFRIAMRKLST